MKDAVRRARARGRVALGRAWYGALVSSRLTKILLSATQRKHAVRWMRSLRKDYLLSTPSPWLTFDAIDFIEGRLPAAARVFEYGSGGSTLFWLQRGAHCTSIEHDADWHRHVGQRLTGMTGVDFRLEPPEIGSGADVDPADPTGYGTGDIALRRHVFRRYVSQIDAFPDEHFDLVLIDGRSRPSCVRHSAAKVKPGGMLVLDNTEVSYYLADARAFLSDYTEFCFRGVIPSLLHWTQTSVFVRRFTNRPREVAPPATGRES